MNDTHCSVVVNFSSPCFLTTDEFSHNKVEILDFFSGFYYKKKKVRGCNCLENIILRIYYYTKLVPVYAMRKRTGREQLVAVRIFVNTLYLVFCDPQMCNTIICFSLPSTTPILFHRVH